MRIPVASIQKRFIGLETEYPRADGRRGRRYYLDSAASSLMLQPAWETADAFLRHYANTHSLLHFGARIATHAYRWAHERVLAFVGADPRRYTCVFVGSGSTAGFNHLARSLAGLRPERPWVLVSDMEHHSNDLPHRKHAQQIEHVRLSGAAPALGALDLEALQKALAAHPSGVKYVAVTAASNVTGIVNPLRAIAEVVHRHGAWLLVDGAQFVAHAPFRMDEGIDFLVFSGHKVYAPGSPGVIVGTRDLLAQVEPDAVGGGMVDDVSFERYAVTAQFPEREEAGTPNIVGAVLLGAALESLMQVGMEAVQAHEQTLAASLLDALAARPGVRVYGDTDLRRTPRVGTVAFNLRGFDHALVAAVLNDYFGVAVRNACFCAHPYVREMLKPELWEVGDDLDLDSADGLAALDRRKGMVRASLGLYTAQADIDALLTGIDALIADPAGFSASYEQVEEGWYRHRRFSAPVQSLFDPGEELRRRMAAA